MLDNMRPMSMIQSVRQDIKDNIVLYVQESDKSLQAMLSVGEKIMREPNFEELRRLYLSGNIQEDNVYYLAFKKGLINEVPYDVYMETYEKSDPVDNLDGVSYHVFRGKDGLPLCMLKSTQAPFGVTMSEPLLIDFNLIDELIKSLKLVKKEEDNDE